jgi:predicted nucleic acid-binding protein
MPKIVCNTTPIISLLKIGKLSILKDLYGEIYVPQEVFNEMEVGKDKQYYTDLSKIDWINITQIKDEKSLSYFLDLDKGEAETIILATEIEADLTIVDETLGRYHARHAELKITGTLGVLLKAKKSGYIKKIKPLLNGLKDKGIWLSNNLIEKILILAGEK